MRFKLYCCIAGFISSSLTSNHHWSDRRHSGVFDSAQNNNLGRSFSLLFGLGLGGSTRINGCQYTPGAPAEYNAWIQDGQVNRTQTLSPTLTSLKIESVQYLGSFVEILVLSLRIHPLLLGPLRLLSGSDSPASMVCTRL